MKKILVVDDSVTFLRYISRILKGGGYSVETAQNGFEALEKAIKEKFDLVITDINMPRMDGYEFVRELRNLPDYKLTPVIAISTLSEYSDRQKGFEAGVDVFITKPVSPSKLLSSIRVLLSSAGGGGGKNEGRANGKGETA